jgi:hypothetical protein
VLMNRSMNSGIVMRLKACATPVAAKFAPLVTKGRRWNQLLNMSLSTAATCCALQSRAALWSRGPSAPPPALQVGTGFLVI